VFARHHTPQEAAELLIDSCPPEMQEQLLQVCERVARYLAASTHTHYTRVLVNLLLV
jgi:hypothetical protein